MADRQQQQQLPDHPQDGLLPQQPPAQQQQQQRTFLTQKLLIIACLGGLAVILASLNVVCKIQINRVQERLLKQSQASSGNAASLSSASSDDDNKKKMKKTIKDSDPASRYQFALHQQPHVLPNTPSSTTAAAQAYWNQFLGLTPATVQEETWHPSVTTATSAAAAVSWQQHVLKEPPQEEDYKYITKTTSSSGSSSSGSSSNSNNHQQQQHDEFQLYQEQRQRRAQAKYFALQQAAKLGHPEAQYVYGNALASGVLPFHTQLNHHDSSAAELMLLQVQEEFVPSQSMFDSQQAEAWLNWHMAAQSGHVAAAVALAHRYETLWEADTKQLANTKKKKTIRDALAGQAEQPGGGSTTRSSSSSFTCSDALPYYQAAAHGIMDQLEVHPHSRAKILPPTEKHLLYQVHLHGGTSSQLDWNNKPDESLDAIQFYHFKAMRPDDPDPQAAVTLATMYHYGYRGVPQNLTLALQYYDAAASAGSWEAAGFAGWFHIFGLGMEPHQRDLHRALKYVRQGLIGNGVEECKVRHQKKKKFKAQDEHIVQCEPGCLNGMGLLLVLGIPFSLDVNIDEAIAYFSLAKVMGHADAAYNLAMLTLGWKSNYLPLEEAMKKFQKDEEEKRKREEEKKQEEGETEATTKSSSTTEGVTRLELPEFMEDPTTMKAGPSQLDMQHAVQYLMIAVQKGHLQARHRLALLYDTGVLSSPDSGRVTQHHSKGRSNKKEVLPQDCDKALKHYKWIVEQASPDILLQLRKAYKDYIAGDLELSLIQYMGIAELGNERAQVNAAFLLEQGTCLGLSSTDCHKASVRYWKAAAAIGNAEASLRVGDFYYYGKLRPPQDPIASMWSRPFGWGQCLIYPEKYLPPLIKSLAGELMIWAMSLMDPDGDQSDDGKIAGDAAGSCKAEETDGFCAATDIQVDTEKKTTAGRSEEDERDLKMAAHYYRIAAEKHSSPRANFNLAFLHEWGLGLTQDFPLAKRHYDLAASASASSREADLAVQIALWTLAIHKYCVRIQMAWEDYWNTSEGTDGASTASTILEAVPKAITNIIGKPVPGSAPRDEEERYPQPGQQHMHRTQMDVIMSHLWTWESLLILILSIVLWVLLQRMRQRTRR